MKIKMLETVEDSHVYIGKDESGKKRAMYDVRKFLGGQEYDKENGGPDFVNRAEGFVDLGKAVEVE